MNIPTYNDIVAFVVEQMQTNQWFQTVGFFGILGIIWQYTRKFPEYLWTRLQRRLTYTVNIYESDNFYEYFEQWLRDNHKASYRNVEIEVSEKKYGHYPGEDDEKGPEKIKYKQYEDIFFIRRGIIWIKVWKGREKLENANNPRSAFINRFEIKAIFGRRVINNLMEEVLGYHKLYEKQNKSSQVKIYVNDGEYWNRVQGVEPKPMDKMILKDKNLILEDVNRFLDNEQWYSDRAVLYKRGYLLYGKPGNGKTSFTLALARELKRNIYVLSPSNISDKGLISLYSDLPRGVILVIEDVDAVFTSNREKKQKKSFNFSTLLNCMDGVFSKPDVITILTTNHPERLDPALIRSGRMDFKFEITNPELDQIEQYMKMFFPEFSYPSLLYMRDNLPTENVVPMVQVQEICMKYKQSPEAAYQVVLEQIQDNEEADTV